MDNTQIKEVLNKAVFKLYRSFPFWGFILERCKISITDKIPTACVDKMGHIMFNPSFVANLSLNQVIFLMAHEVHHVALSHHERCNKRNKLQWNMATDYVINLSLVKIFQENSMPCKIPGMLYNTEYTDMAAETVYNLLNDSNTEDNEMPDLTYAPFEGDSDLVKDYRIVPNAKEMENQTRNWKSISVEASTTTKLYGTMSEDIEREVLNNLKPKVNWYLLLKRLLQDEYLSQTTVDYTFNKRNRRQGNISYIMPAKEQHPNKKPIIFAIDTSGSVDEQTLGQAISELTAIQEAFNIDIYMIQCDTKIQEARWIRNKEWKKIKLKGGGGTDFKPIFTHVKKENMENSLLIVYTDGYGEFPTEKPRNKTVWLMDTDVIAPWGTTIKIEK